MSKDKAIPVGYNENRDESFDSNDIKDTLLWRLEDYKHKGITVLDVKVDRGTLEQHFINISKGENE